MDVRFLILFPEKNDEILFALQAVLDPLRRAFPAAWIAGIIQRDHHWLIAQSTGLDEIFTFESSPRQLIHELHKAVPDHLIDLSASSKHRRFKNRLGATDFAFSRKQIRVFSEINLLPDKKPVYQKMAHDLIEVFDVPAVNSLLKWTDSTANAFVSDALPSEFVSGYIVCDLEDDLQPTETEESEFQAMLEFFDHPIVLLGSAQQRHMADRFAQQSGCHVFPVCGDFKWVEEQWLLAGASGILGDTKRASLWACVQSIALHGLGQLLSNPDEAKEALARLRKKVKKQP